VGTGDDIHFWADNWFGEPLVELLHSDPVYHSRFKGMVAFVIDHGTWDVHHEVLVVKSRF